MRRLYRLGCRLSLGTAGVLLILSAKALQILVLLGEKGITGLTPLINRVVEADDRLSNHQQ